MKLREETRERICKRGLGRDFLALTPTAQSIFKRNTWDRTKIKNFCSLKYTRERNGLKPQTWKNKDLQSVDLTKHSYSEYKQELLKLNDKKHKQPHS